MQSPPTVRTVLAPLTKGRLEELGRDLGLALPGAATKDAQLEAFAKADLPLAQVLGGLGRDELRAACRAHGLDFKTRARSALIATLAGSPKSQPVERPRKRSAEDLPQPGDLVHVRHRQYLVETVAPGLPPEATRVDLVCL